MERENQPEISAAPAASKPTLEQRALEYHCMHGRPGKIEVCPTKPMTHQDHLSLAYTPGVAAPVLAIADNPELVYEYTAKSNLVGVITNGSAILGLGNRGPLAAKPVMEGKGVLFKQFAQIDVFDIELDAPDADQFVAAVKAMAPTFGGINLEDIKAPECFYIEQALQACLDIPVFHDDQHGTAVIAGAAVINGLELVGKSIEQARVVCVGAGAAAMACMDMIVHLGIKRENILMVDPEGVLYQGRPGLEDYKLRFAQHTKARTIYDAFEGADVFYGLSGAGAVDEAMLKAMAAGPLILPLANPEPEISYERARQARPDAIVGTGRSDYPNQINNVLGFPYIFRGALDVRATCINQPMKVAAAMALAALAKEAVPQEVLDAYGLTYLEFGPDYLLPKALDPRVLLWEAPAVAQAAMNSRVARKHIDIEQYRQQLAARQGEHNR